MTDLGALYFDVRRANSHLMMDFVDTLTYPNPPECTPENRKHIEAIFPRFKYGTNELEIRLCRTVDVFRLTSTDPDCTLCVNDIQFKIGTGPFMMMRSWSWFINYVIKHKGDFKVEFYYFPLTVREDLKLVSCINFHLPLPTGQQLYAADNYGYFMMQDTPKKAELQRPCKVLDTQEALLDNVEDLIRGGILTRI